MIRRWILMPTWSRPASAGLGHFTNRDDREWFQQSGRRRYRVCICARPSRARWPTIWPSSVRSPRPTPSPVAGICPSDMPSSISSAPTRTSPRRVSQATGALSSQGLRILSADITTLADGLIFDRFYVEDPDHADAPPESRVQQVCQALVTALKQADGKLPQFPPIMALVRPTSARQSHGAADSGAHRQQHVGPCHDHRHLRGGPHGVLYTISRTLFELGLNVSVAKIGTYLDQVVDVFYVTEQNGTKLEDEQAAQRSAWASVGRNRAT